MNVLTEYTEAKQRLFDHFNYTGYDYSIEDSTEVYWKIDGREIMWSEEQWDEDSSPDYAEEIRGVYRADNLTMIVVYSCTGDKYLGVFDNTKEIKE